MPHSAFTFLLTATLFATSLFAQDASTQEEFSQADKLRGSITPERAWWDLLKYELEIEVLPESKEIKGSNRVVFKAIKPGKRMQIDLQKPLEITEVKYKESPLKFEREGNVYWISFEETIQPGTEARIDIFYGGKPTESKNPPWSGGISWRKDKNGDPFIATSCQGIGASIWWPCKDHGYDEPDQGVKVSITVPEDLTAVSNGRLAESSHNSKSKTRTFTWLVTNPINNYCINMNIGNYVRMQEKHRGESGNLDLDYWVLKHHREDATRQFVEVPRTVEAFEYWFGPYPFYEDSYKLVQVPYLGMEHQSSVTYGNGFKNGYRGRDLSGTGVGLKFDFIIVHESGHEWFGNNVSMKDAADMWIHESFTNYSENLFVEYFFTRKEAEDYVIGCRKLVRNDRPIIGTYNVNRSGSGDMYYKGGNMLHTIRHIIDNDIKWRRILRGINSTFWHQTVTTEQIEKYMSEESGTDLSCVFDQYLRSTKIPKLVYQVDGNKLTMHFENVVPGFKIPIKASIDGNVIRMDVSEEPNTYTASAPIDNIVIDRNFYVETVQAKE